MDASTETQHPRQGIDSASKICFQLLGGANKEMQVAPKSSLEQQSASSALQNYSRKSFYSFPKVKINAHRGAHDQTSTSSPFFECVATSKTPSPALRIFATA